MATLTPNPGHHRKPSSTLRYVFIFITFIVIITIVTVLLTPLRSTTHTQLHGLGHGPGAGISPDATLARLTAVMAQVEQRVAAGQPVSSQAVEELRAVRAALQRNIEQRDGYVPTILQQQLGLRFSDFDPLPEGESAIGYALQNITIGAPPAAPQFHLMVHAETTQHRQPAMFTNFWRWVNAGRWEADTLFIYSHVLTPDTVLIDFGAWIGPTVLYGAKFAGEVWGLEIDPVAYSEAVRNILANQYNMELPLDRIHMRRLCISDRTETREFGALQSAGDSMSSLLFTDPAQHADNEIAKQHSANFGKTKWIVQCTELDRFVSSEGIWPGTASASAPTPIGRRHWQPSHMFIKMDIEGGEAMVLPAIADWATSPAVQAEILLSVHVQHVRNHKNDGYPVADIERVVAAMKKWPFIYQSHPQQGFQATALNIEELTPHNLCGDCTFLMRFKPISEQMRADAAHL